MKNNGKLNRKNWKEEIDGIIKWTRGKWLSERPKQVQLIKRHGRNMVKDFWWTINIEKEHTKSRTKKLM